MCWHKWGKWEEYKVTGTYVPTNWFAKGRMEAVQYVEMWQKRVCNKCGYTQRKRVDSEN
jgi:hypothetical protein